MRPSPPVQKWGALEVLIVIALLASIGAIAAAYNHFAYDDWTCAFKRCVSVKP